MDIKVFKIKYKKIKQIKMNIPKILKNLEKWFKIWKNDNWNLNKMVDSYFNLLKEH